MTCGIECPVLALVRLIEIFSQNMLVGCTCTGVFARSKIDILPSRLHHATRPQSSKAEITPAFRLSFHERAGQSPRAVGSNCFPASWRIVSECLIKPPFFLLRTTIVTFNASPTPLSPPSNVKIAWKISLHVLVKNGSFASPYDRRLALFPHHHGRGLYDRHRERSTLLLQRRPPWPYLPPCIRTSTSSDGGTPPMRPGGPEHVQGMLERYPQKLRR